MWYRVFKLLIIAVVVFLSFDIPVYAQEKDSEKKEVFEPSSSEKDTHQLKRMDIPSIKKDCFLCHTLNNRGTIVRLKLPINDLCLQCHADRGTPTEHQVGMEPTMRVKYLPLYGGKITCATCHEPHGLTGHLKNLRALPSEICSFCHNM